MLAGDSNPKAQFFQDLRSHTPSHTGGGGLYSEGERELILAEVSLV